MNHELDGGAAGLSQEHHPTAHHTLNCLRCMMADGDKLHILIVFHFVLALQSLDAAVHPPRFRIRTDGKAQGGVLHHIDPNPMLRQYGENIGEIIHSYEGEILRENRDQRLVVFDNIGGNRRVQWAFGDNAALGIWLEKRFNVQWYLFVLQGF